MALTKPAVGFLRQGCNLVLDIVREPDSNVVFATGRRESSRLTHEAALVFAKKAAAEFGVGESRTVKFDKAVAKQETSGEKSKGKGKAKQK